MSAEDKAVVGGGQGGDDVTVTYNEFIGRQSLDAASLNIGHFDHTYACAVVVRHLTFRFLKRSLTTTLHFRVSHVSTYQTQSKLPFFTTRPHLDLRS